MSVVGARLRVLVGVVVRLEYRNVLDAVEPLDAVLPALMEIDGARVRDREHARVVDGADRAFLSTSRKRYSIDEPLRSPTRAAGE